MYSGPGVCSVEVSLVWWPVSVPFLSMDLLVRFVESLGFCCPPGDSLFRTFVEAAVVVGRP